MIDPLTMTRKIRSAFSEADHMPRNGPLVVLIPAGDWDRFLRHVRMGLDQRHFSMTVLTDFQKGDIQIEGVIYRQNEGA